jgi:alkanesulfonate monooxygenase SsuD/methylene tetrahydromethanopterin reductase-like flavin-dependent oxidoreductase (luciferase family)
LKTYRQEFQPSRSLQQPYSLAGINVFVADTDVEAEQLFTSMIRMFIGVLTGAREPLQPPTALTGDLKEVLQHPSLHQMLKYSFVGSKPTVKKAVIAFLHQTGVNELIIVNTMYDINARIKSTRLFSEIMKEINGVK